MSLGLLSNRPGWPSGVPRTMRGEPQIILDTNFIGNVDLSPYASHTIDGRVWTTSASSGTPTTVELQADGLAIDWQVNNQTWEMVTDLGADLDRNAQLCVFLAFDPSASLGNGCNIGVRLMQSTSFTTEHDVAAALRGTSGGCRWQTSRRTASGTTLHYVGNNPIGSVPSAASLMVVVGGFGMKFLGNQSTSVPAFRNLTSSDSADGWVSTRSAGVTAAGVSPLRRYLSLYVYDTTTTVKVQHLRVWRL